MQIDCIPRDFIINMAKKVKIDGNTKIRSDFLLRAIRIMNTLDHPVTINHINFDAKVKSKIVKSISYSADILQERSAELAPLIPAFDKVRDNERSFFGTEFFWLLKKFTRTNLLERGEMTGLLLEHFIVLHNSPVDELEVKVDYLINEMAENAVLSIPVREYECKNSYLFPLKGIWLVVNNWDDLHGHRCSISQEFAIDLIQLDENGQFPLDKPNDYYSYYETEVYAVADGTVVTVRDFCPENPRAGELADMDVKTVYKEHGLLAVTAGNYVIIKHQNQEYSFYAHLVKGSIRVKEGDNVKQGDIIGALGNSGNSDAPHLHFEIRNDKKLGAQGLPCHFINISDTFGKTVTRIDQNYSTVKTH